MLKSKDDSDNSDDVEFEAQDSDDDEENQNQSDSDDNNSKQEGSTKEADDDDSHNGSVASVPIDDAPPEQRPNVEDPNKKKQAKYKSNTPLKPRDPFWRNMSALAFLGVIIVSILILILHFTIGQKDDDNDITGKYGASRGPPPAPPAPTPVPALLDPEWVEDIQQRKATPFDAYDPEPEEEPNCDFTAVNQPDVVLQCECNGSVDTIAEDIQELYDELRTTLVPAIYGEDWQDVEPTSCDSRNQALLWLASGNTRQNTEDLIQRYAMTLLHPEWKGPEWKDDSNWRTDANECTWLYATCNTEDKVVSLGFGDEVGVSGKIPTQLALLSELKDIKVLNNYLSGTIPSQLMTVTQLKSLVLTGNELTGSIPSQVANLQELSNLNAHDNQLSGTLVTEIGLLSTNLQELDIGFNDMEGGIPSEIANLKQMTELNLEDNNFSGFLPSELSRIRDLQVLNLAGLSLEGGIPSEFGRFKELETLLVGNSGLEGGIPTDLGYAESLEVLHLNGNKLEGPLPTELGRLDKMVNLDASDNRLTGPLPSQYGLMVDMKQLALYDNGLSGTVPVQYGKMKVLEVLSLYENPKLNGPMPGPVCNANPDANILVTCGEEGDESGIVCPEDCCDCQRR